MASLFTWQQHVYGDEEEERGINAFYFGFLNQVKIKIILLITCIIVHSQINLFTKNVLLNLRITIPNHISTILEYHMRLYLRQEKEDYSDV